MKTKKIIFDYLKIRLPILIVFAIIFCCSAVIMLLYDISAEPIIYTLTFEFVLLSIFAVFDCVTYINKVKTLSHYNPIVDSPDLFAPKSLLEKEAVAKIVALRDETNRLVTAIDLKRSETEDYYAMWAHQIKTPIAGLKLMIENKKLDLSDYKRELLRIDGYVEMVMGYARMDSMEHDFSFSTVKVDELIKAVAKKFSLEFILSKLAFDFKPTSIIVVTDEKWLQFALEQIFSNSLKYTTKGKISVYSSQNALIIEDTGIGISSEDLPRITERGFTGLNGRFDKKSSGLGLYLTSTILSKLNIDLKIESKVAFGTKITLDFSNITKK